ncbi:hypothetical protein [Anaerobacillus sp. 1_MG-2023]|nr:hypothetical protein [Anaerobacillus sp. 1_MG-2023]MDO6657465.1 hypothetical protein [Anaerobacillus sp. 1_MG-2023]
MSKTTRFIASLTIVAFMFSPFAHYDFVKGDPTDSGITTKMVRDPGGGMG